MDRFLAVVLNNSEELLYTSDWRLTAGDASIALEKRGPFAGHASSTSG